MKRRRRFKKYKTLAGVLRRARVLSALCQEADDRTRAAREELWCLYAQEQLLEKKKART